ncbi:hypothetical protein KC878_01455 [Candidatus Saccharibacteria bacterium]|nr:hypothetical protein [Candidatus Saccharibacteria bacterium]MCB9821192.1 hypothetical protein [Candidatus Nomurabacteria bacterium]
MNEDFHSDIGGVRDQLNSLLREIRELQARAAQFQSDLDRRRSVQLDPGITSVDAQLAEFRLKIMFLRTELLDVAEGGITEAYASRVDESMPGVVEFYNEFFEALQTYVFEPDWFPLRLVLVPKPSSWHTPSVSHTQLVDSFKQELAELFAKHGVTSGRVDVRRGQIVAFTLDPQR